MKEFKKGHKIKVIDGDELTIIKKIGEGGQGVVYKVKYNGKDYALKWYFIQKISNKEKFYKNIQSNIKKGAPTESFLWPLAITEYFEGSFGYLMDLRPTKYKDFSLFLLAKEKFSKISTVINAALNITNAFRELHRLGFSYQDLNDGNFFIDPKTGKILICDNDNVAEYGTSLGIAGKCRYMAPEIVNGEKSPDIHTDRFSLSVVLYLLLFLNHPLEGYRTMCPCLTEELEKIFFAIEPLFVWDKKDDRNRPVKNIHRNEIKAWPLYPRFIKNIFQEAFSQELMIGKDKEHRITENRWQEAFVMLRDCLVLCSCKDETFIDMSEESYRCINCNKNIIRPLVLRVKRFNVVLMPGKKLYACHTIYDSDDFKTETGEFLKSGKDLDSIKLKNISDQTWLVKLQNGLVKELKKDEMIKLEYGLKINFGNKNIAEII